MMSKSTLNHSIILLISLLLAFVWLTNPNLADYSLQLTAFLVVFLVFSRKVFGTSSFLILESVISTLAIVLLTASTGGLSSPFFFLNYFLLFELSLLLEPNISVILTLGLMVFYLFSYQVGGSLYNLVYLFSFIFMTPLAFITGNAYRMMNNKIDNSPAPPLFTPKLI